MSTFRGGFLKIWKYNLAHTSDSDRARRVLPESAEKSALAIVEQRGGVWICTECNTQYLLITLNNANLKFNVWIMFAVEANRG